MGSTICFWDDHESRIREWKGSRNLGGIYRNGQKRDSCGVVLLLKVCSNLTGTDFDGSSGDVWQRVLSGKAISRLIFFVNIL